VSALSRPPKTDFHNLPRRNFLIRCCQGASAALLPPFLRSIRPLSFLSPAEGAGSAPEFHVHPHYRSQRPLDALLLKTQAGFDEFISEKYADQIDTVLAAWTKGLLQTPSDFQPIAAALSKNFSGSSLRPSESRQVRSGVVEVHQRKFRENVTGRDNFPEELRSALASFSQILTAELQITAIDASNSPSRLITRIRYELVGPGKDFYREQRVGYWELEWESTSSGSFSVIRWTLLGEMQSRAMLPVFADITAQALGNIPSYSGQLLHGSDYWRTVLDGACGIDIYGHNGVSVGDIDNDGYDDLYICQPAGLPNRLYRNRGDGTFEDVTEASGVGVLENTACALWIDVDNDGRQDLIVVRTNGPLLFLNQGSGRFQQKPNAFKFADPPQGTFTGAAAADYDRDGWLDLYFCLYSYYQGTDQYRYPLPYYDAQNGPPNFMMRNNRDGTFRDVTAESGLNRNNNRYSFCCGWSDYNHDGWPDLYVVNDFGRKNLYRNNGDGTFADISEQAAAEDIGAGMSVAWFDYDNDGAEDLYVADMWTAAGERVSTQEIFKKDSPQPIRSLYQKHAMGNSLLRNERASFADRSNSAAVSIGRWSWSSDAWDFDHDSFQDLYIVNGMVSGPETDDLNSFFWRQVVAKSPDDASPAHDYEQGWNAINELIRSDRTWSGYERNVFYANNRDGTFSDVSGAVGLDFVEDGRSFALADFNHDGRLETFLKNRNAPQVRVLQNVIRDLPPSISFRLRGTKSNRDAIGTVITVNTESGRLTRSLEAGSGFLSQHTKDVLFGLGDAKGPTAATIRWPNGLVQELHNLPINHRVWVEEGSDLSRLEPFRKHEKTAINPEIQLSPGVPEPLPASVETWLLAPFPAPDFTLKDLTGKEWGLAAERGKAVLLCFWSMYSPECQKMLQSLARAASKFASPHRGLLAIHADDSTDSGRLSAFGRGFSFPILYGSDDVIAVYNIVYRQLFDRHRDLQLSTSFLIDERGDIVKVYLGTIDPDRVARDFERVPLSSQARPSLALPFGGITDTADFQRNYLSYGSIFFQRGYYDQSGLMFQRASEDDPSSAEALYGLGSVRLQEGKLSEARQNFDRVTKLRASYPETLPNAWNNLGLIATREGRMPDAIANFQQALKISPNHLVALENLGNAYRQEKQWEDARTALARAIAVDPHDPEVNYSLAMVYAQLNDVDQAYQYLQRALQLRPAYPEALNNLGILYLRTQRRDEAVAEFEECIRVAPGFDQSYLNLARVYAIEGSPAKAREILQGLLKQHPDHAQAKSMLEELGKQ
jgi:tetratricopeptide (TPR) repeat protein